LETLIFGNLALNFSTKCFLSREKKQQMNDPTLCSTDLNAKPSVQILIKKTKRSLYKHHPYDFGLLMYICDMYLDHGLATLKGPGATSILP